jgi:DNA invertase Pin-like site-specific DNA recombinase
MRVIEDNDTSATSRRKRKGWEQLMTMVRAGQVDVIVAYAVDRLVRRLADLEALIDLIDAHHITVITVAGELDLSTPAGRLNARILASVARAEVETKAARQQRSSLQRAKDGRPHIGRRTVGYDHGLKAVRADEAALIREGFSQLVAGASLRMIVRDWNSAGFTTTSGKQWTSRGVRLALTNQRYVGASAYRARSTEAEVMGQGQWQALVTPDVFDAAQRILNDPARTIVTPGRERKHLLAGLALCGKCGLVMRSGAQRGQALIRCQETHLARRAADVEAFVRAEVIKRLRLPNAGIKVSGAQGVDQAALRDEAAALEVKLDGLMADWEADLITKAQRDSSTARIRARQEAIREARAAAVANSVLTPLLAQADPGAAFERLDLERERLVVQALCVVTIHAPGYGRQAFNPATVTIDWL